MMTTRGARVGKKNYIVDALIREIKLYYVGTVNGPTSITRLGVWKMYQKVASFSILDTPPQKQTLTIFWGGV